MACDDHVVHRTPVGPRRAGLLLGLGAALGLAGCSSPTPVPVPSPDAAPVDVVEAYVAAINAGDRAALATLSADGRVPDAWLGSRIDLISVGDPTNGAGVGTRYGDQPTVGVTVRAEFHDTDPSLPDGRPVGWTYLLVEQNGRWVVYDQGQG